MLYFTECKSAKKNEISQKYSMFYIRDALIVFL